MTEKKKPSSADPTHYLHLVYIILTAEPVMRWTGACGFVYGLSVDPLYTLKL